MTLKKARIALGTLLVTSIMFASAPTVTWGKERPRVIAIENSHGLEVRVPKKTMDLGNLNPGDRKETTLRVSNTGNDQITVFIRTNILEEATLRDGYLADIMNFSMTEKGNVLANNTFRAVRNMENILIGTLKPGDYKILDFASYLPGAGAGNEYQGAYLKVSWTFITQSAGSRNPGGGGGGSKKRTELPKDPEEFIIEDDLVPLGQDELEIPETSETPETPETPEEAKLILEDEKVPNHSEITIEDGKIPFDGIKLPKTGQLASGFFYGAGSFLIMLGVYRKKER